MADLVHLDREKLLLEVANLQQGGWPDNKLGRVGGRLERGEDIRLGSCVGTVDLHDDLALRDTRLLRAGPRVQLKFPKNL